MDQEVFEALSVFLYIAIIAIVIFINFKLAHAAKDAAEDKGYSSGASAFWITFLFGAVGFLYVIALPDKIARAQREQRNKLLNYLIALQNSSQNTAEETEPVSSSKETEQHQESDAPKKKRNVSNCRFISTTPKRENGHCHMCSSEKELSMCKVTWDDGEVEFLPLCDACITRLKNNSKG